ncbi:MAG: hypothetical protein K0S93_390 [Nitrososphaeraceae archaeon]|jgi:hypothetical protein|nr:hypothetical protein [Nitrososphaeraceae archaeon]
MKAVPLLLFAMSSLSFIVIAPVSIGSSYALKDEDGRFGIVTLENLKGRSVEVTMFIYDEDKNKNIKGTPEPIDETSASVKHTFKFDNDDFPNSAGPGTQIITCIEFKNGKGEPSCYTDTLKSESQPYRVTLDVDYIRD